MSKHTPGPWKAVRCRHGWHIGPQPGGVCTICDDSQFGDVADRSRYLQQEANARLIAAAPELLAALERVYPHGCASHDVTCPYVRGGDYTSCNCKPGRALAVIAKTEGSNDPNTSS